MWDHGIFRSFPIYTIIVFHSLVGFAGGGCFNGRKTMYHVGPCDQQVLDMHFTVWVWDHLSINQGQPILTSYIVSAKKIYGLTEVNHIVVFH